ncbi:MAG: response regulator [Candidatus Zixiibacteriota bacterium]
MSAAFAIVSSIIVLVTAVFLVYRLGFFASEKLSGRYAFLIGGFLLFVASAWQVIRYTTDYNLWFIDEAYPILDIGQLLIFVLGSLLMVVGLALYADFWQTRREELSIRDQHLSILNNLQDDARQPYQTMELLDIAIKEIVSHLPETSGAIFLANRSLRQLVLTSSVGFTKQETAFLERYPFGQNVVSQAIEMSEPIITGNFVFVDALGKSIVSPYNCCLVLPLAAGTEKIGAMLLLSQQSKAFGRAEIRYLSPVANWLAETVRSSRLAKELASVKGELSSASALYDDFKHRIVSSADAFSASEILTAFCRSLVGLAGSQSVQLLGMKNGMLHIFGGSQPLIDLSENYRTALIEALDRRKPLIINQEASGDEGRTYIARSTLLYPMGDQPETSAIMFMKDGSPFRVSDDVLKTMEVFTKLARLTIQQSEMHRLDITRRKGLDKIVRLLRVDRSVNFQAAPGFFVKHLAGVLPVRSVAVTFAKQRNGSFKAVDGVNVAEDQLEGIETLPGEGVVGSVAVDAQTHFISGRNNVIQALRSFDEVNRDNLQKLFGEQGQPNFMAACPIVKVDEIEGVALFFMFDVSENEKNEWPRLLTLASGLFSLRLTITDLYEKRLQPETADAVPAGNLGEIVNQLNNHLAAIVGNAGLAEVRQDLTGELRQQFRGIIDEAERAADLLRSALGENNAEISPAEAVEQPATYQLNDIVDSVLTGHRISDNLHMLAGRPREIKRQLGSVQQVAFGSDALRSLFEEAISRFASVAEDDDVITVATYTRDGYVYLDVSRHHRDFPPVQNVAGFGHYQQPSQALQHRPSDTFLKHLGDRPSYYSVDRVSSTPSYLSFKFPIKSTPTVAATEGRRPRILAIDDQAVILDLISAMCQSTGYDVKTAETGQGGLEMALREKFDVILTDLAMPGLSGVEIAHEIRKKRPNVPVVLVTGYEVKISAERLEAAGITRVLHKPFRIEQLTEIIESLIKQPTA